MNKTYLNVLDDSCALSKVYDTQYGCHSLQRMKC